MKEALRLASFDMQRRIPDQIWYDALRQDDDGRYAKTNCLSPKLDYASRNELNRKAYLKNKIIGLKEPSTRPFNSTTRNFYAPVRD